MPDCHACIHPKRAELDKSLATESLSTRLAATRYRLTQSCVARHMKEHLPARVLAAVERAGIRADAPLVERAKWLENKSREWLARAEEGDVVADILLCVREARACLDLQAKLLGAYAPVKVDATVSVLAAPEWTELRADILAALERHPEAKADVLAAIEARAVTKQLPP